LCNALRSHTPILAGDVSGRRASLMSMRSMDLICPSEAELRNAVHDYDDGLSAVVARVLHRTGSRSALITLADEGVIADQHLDLIQYAETAEQAWDIIQAFHASGA